jgi:type II secretory ATPase GspE/PulE/Tfp pilus assembly ATPase PilB-like protein
LQEYFIRCWNCLGEYDAMAAIWCSCNPNHPTKVCPFCLLCFCAAPEIYHDKFWAGAPEELVKDREMLARARGPLGQALVQAKVITSDQLLLALKHQKKTGGRLGEILVELGFLTPQTLSSFLSMQRSVPQVSLRDYVLDPMLIASIGAEECLKRMVVPLSREMMAGKEMLTLAMANPSDGGAIEFLQNMLGCLVLPVQTQADELKRALEPFVPDPGLPAQPAVAPAEGQSLPPASGAQMATDLLRKALARGASDLYLEPKEEEVSVHIRIDGMLYKAKSLGRDIQDVLTFELKRLLRLDTAVKDRPQEGRVVMRSGDVRFDVIAHCLPTRFGENLALKIINRDTFFKSYDQLGLPADDQIALRAALSAQRGLILLTAPLFHGSTTLYAVMKDLSSDGQRKLMSIEAQSICPVPNVSQVSLGENKDDEATLTTLKALASIQPDVCVLGDLLETTNMAGQMIKLASQMLVIATLEATSTTQAVQKVVDLGVPAPDLSQHLLLVLNQRLVRRICAACVQPSGLSERSLQLMGLSPEEAVSLSGVSQGQGCEACSGIGYKGRIALFEVLTPGAGYRKALGKASSEKVLEREAVKQGLQTLRMRALQSIRDGRTTIEEFQKEHF